MPPPVTPKSPSFVTLPDDTARQVFDEALDRLSPLQRQVFLMRLRSESDLERIAVRLGVPRDSARASLAYAVAQLRMILSDAPLDKQRNDWLQRCRQLLVRPARRGAVPAVEVELPGITAAIAPDPAPPPTLIVESRQATPVSLPLAEAISPLPELPASRPMPTRPIPPAVTPNVAPPNRARHHRSSYGLWPRLPAALGVLVLLLAGFLIWQGLGPSAPTSMAEVTTEPQRVPPLDAAAAPLTASDFRLVLLRQQQPGLLENLDFYIWLSEQDALR